MKMRSRSSEYNEDKNMKRLSEFIPLSWKVLDLISTDEGVSGE